MVELQVLNLVIKKKDYTIISHNELNDTYFPVYTSEFQFIKNHVEAYRTVPDIETVLDRFPDFDVIDVQESEEYLVSKLVEEYVFKNAVPLLKKGYELVQEDAIQGLAYLESILPQLTHKNRTKVVDLVEFADKRLQKYREKMRSPLASYITTGFSELDKIIGGWDRQEENALVVARTGQGKSWVAVMMAMAAAKCGYKVGYYSGEMSDTKLGYRFDSVFSHISNWKITHGSPEIEAEYEKSIEEFKKVSGHIYVLSPEEIGGLAGVNTLKTFIEKHKLDILIVDQVSLLKDDRNGRTTVDRFSNIATDLRVMQSTLKLPVISVSQFNRDEPDDKEPGTKQIAGSDRLGQDATFVLSITQKPNNILELKIVKARDSKAGDKLTYNWNIDTGELTFIPTAASDAASASSTMPTAETVTQTSDIRSQYRDRRQNIF